MTCKCPKCKYNAIFFPVGGYSQGGDYGEQYYERYYECSRCGCMLTEGDVDAYLEEDEA